MFAKSIVLSDAFLDMPMSARCLYFTLSMFADDDGFVSSPKGIMRQCGASEDDLRVLLAKRYVLAFESGVIVIKHWRINNFLRKDRYTTTTYQEELSTLSLDEKGAYVESVDCGQPNMGQPRVDKNRVDKISIDKSRVEDPVMTDDEIIESIKSAFNSQSNITARIQVIPPLNRRWNNVMLCVKQYGLDTVLEAIRHLDDNVFFRTWKPSFDWVVDPNNMLKIIEGNYKQGKEDLKSNDASAEWIAQWVADDDEE